MKRSQNPYLPGTYGATGIGEKQATQVEKRKSPVEGSFLYKEREETKKRIGFSYFLMMM